MSMLCFFIGKRVWVARLMESTVHVYCKVQPVIFISEHLIIQNNYWNARVKQFDLGVLFVKSMDATGLNGFTWTT